MNILYFGVFDGKDWRSEYPMLQALQALGDQVATVNFRSRFPGTIQRGVRRHLADADLVFVQNGIPMNPVHSLRFRPKPYLLFASEFGLDQHLPMLQAPHRPDFVIAHAEPTVRYCREQGIPVERLPNAFNPAFYHAIETPFRYDVCFIGGMTPRRQQLLDQLRKRYGDRLYIGKNWDPREVNRLYNQSKIVFHMHAKDERYMPTRLFEVLPTNACFVSESFGANQHPLVAEQGYVDYQDFDEAISKIDALIGDEAWRQRVVSAAQAEAPRHSWAARMKDFRRCFEAGIEAFSA